MKTNITIKNVQNYFIFKNDSYFFCDTTVILQVIDILSRAKLELVLELQ